MTIPLRPVERASASQPEYHPFFIVWSFALSLGLGFLLAVLVPLSRALSLHFEASRPDLVQVHGEVQMWGLLGLFIMGMALRLMPRFSHRHLLVQSLVLPMLVLVVVALLARSLVVIWLPEHSHNVAVLGVSLVLLLASFYFAAIALGTLLPSGARNEATVWFFVAGALLLLMAGGIGVVAAVEELRDATTTYSYLADTAVIYTFLGGFVVSVIAGVSGRALPPMVGRRREEAGGRVVALSLFLWSSVLAATLLYLEFVAYVETVVRAAGVSFVGLGLTWAAIIWLSGVLHPAANRVRQASQPHMWIVRAAFLWLLFASVLAVYAGVRTSVDATLPDTFVLDALRHALGFGVATSLIVGMALLILPEFAGERLAAPNQSGKSFFLLILVSIAALLRVASSLLGTHINLDERSYMQATAGVLAEVVILKVALDFLRLRFVRR